MAAWIQGMLGTKLPVETESMLPLSPFLVPSRGAACQNFNQSKFEIKGGHILDHTGIYFSRNANEQLSNSKHKLKIFFVFF